MLKKIVIITAAAAAAGALSFGAVGLAGAASAPSSNPPTPTAQTPSSQVPKAGRNFNCANASKVLARIQKIEGQIAAGLPKLTAAEAKATANGNTTRATKIQNRITRLESSTFKARLDKVSQKIEAKCNVAAPTA
ncbi:MAG TPA: hypothetical protein VMV06_01895 [Acidimicrobiales bacterium]|nr:hypothetical protein [Acidimicrobiales bacterium]